jgi:hypothetical protein
MFGALQEKNCTIQQTSFLSRVVLVGIELRPQVEVCGEIIRTLPCFPGIREGRNW